LFQLTFRIDRIGVENRGGLNAVTVIVEFNESSGKTKVTVTEVGIPLIVMILSRVAWDQQFDKIEGLL
jgi:hypothetical protein